MELVVGRLGRPHGVQGEISVEIRTDEPEERFKNGVKLFLKENKKKLNSFNFQMASTKNACQI